MGLEDTIHRCTEASKPENTVVRYTMGESMPTEQDRNLDQGVSILHSKSLVTDNQIKSSNADLVSGQCSPTSEAVNRKSRGLDISAKFGPGRKPLLGFWSLSLWIRIRCIRCIIM